MRTRATSSTAWEALLTKKYSYKEEMDKGAVTFVGGFAKPFQEDQPKVVWQCRVTESIL